MSDTSNKILIGKIVAPQGLRGEVRVQTYTSNPEDIKDLKILDLDVKFIRRAAPDVAIAKIARIDDRTAAESLRGTELFIERESLPQLPDGEYYQTDLIGMTVNQSGVIAGTVVAMHNFGAGDILELDNGEMVSFKNADVDMANKTIYTK